MQDDDPELAGYEPGDGRPLRSRRTTIGMRILVVIGLLGLVLPQIVTQISVAASSAKASCARWVAYENPGAPGSTTRFELFGPGLIGWECYTAGAFGGDQHVASLGLIPGPPALPSGPATAS